MEDAFGGILPHEFRIWSYAQVREVIGLVESVPQNVSADSSDISSIGLVVFHLYPAPASIWLRSEISVDSGSPGSLIHLKLNIKVSMLPLNKTSGSQECRCVLVYNDTYSDIVSATVVINVLELYVVCNESNSGSNLFAIAIGNPCPTPRLLPFVKVEDCVTTFSTEENVVGFA